MVLTQQLSSHIVSISLGYLGRPFDWNTFNCVHFIRSVYGEAGIRFPILAKAMLPPCKFHLSVEEFELMPLGHSVFLKRKAKVTDRSWSHIAIIIGPNALIHCTRHMGQGVITSSKDALLQVYDLASKAHH